MDFCESQAAALPALADKYNEFSELFSKKLWHQLTDKLYEFVSDRRTLQGDNWFSLYSNFITNFEARLNPVRMSTLVSIIGLSFADAGKSLQLFEELLQNRDRLGGEASLCLEMDTVIARLRLGQTAEAKATLATAKENLSQMSSPQAVVFSKFYRARAEYRKVVGPPQEFYKDGLMFLAYTPLEEMLAADASALGRDIALAAITGADIFNFGEVLATPILGALSGTPDAWLTDLVLALHHGSISEFNTCVDANRAAYFAMPALANTHEEVKRKVVLLALMNIVFKRGSNDRTITFSDIASRTAIPVDQVEWVIMRAMSLSLVKGSIDQVEQSVDVTWVQPRILDKTQLGVISDQLGNWADRVKDTLVTVEDQTAELYC